MMDKSTKDHASAIHVALFIFPKIMREMINNKWSPKDVIKRIEIDKGQIFMNKLTQEAKSMIANMKRNGYFALDVCCLYQVIRYFNLLSSPKQGWGVNPKADDKRKADDVERMKILRNNIIHCPQGGLSESDRKKFFEQSIDIAERMDKRNGSPVNGFKSEIEKVQIDSVSIASQENFEKCPKYQGKLQITTDKRYVSLYYGNDIMMKIDAQNDQENVTKKEVTVAIIKPDAVKAGKVDQILENIREAGIIILLQKEIKFTEEDIKQLYLHLQDQDFFKDLVQFMTSDISHVLVLTKGKSGENIIEEFKDLIGPSDIIEATTKKPNSLRAKYGENTFRNALHGSYSSEMAKRELAFLFPDFEVTSLESKTDILQTTLALLRPAAFRQYKEKFLTKIRDLGFKIAMQTEVLLTREKAEEFYKEQKGEKYFEQFVSNMTSDYVLALGLSRQNAIREWRKLLGPKEVSVAKNEAPLSLRAQFAVHDTINSLHGSDSEETAKKELQLFFPLEETVAVLKPDAERHKDKIVNKIHEAGFKIVDRKETILSREIAENLYAGHQHTDYYNDLIEHMTSGPTYFMVLSREDAVKGFRSLIGPTDPEQARNCSPDSIRAMYGESKLKNAVNGSPDPEHAEKTIKTIFGDRSSSCIIYLRDQNIDVNSLLQKIDDIKESIRTENYQMKDCIALTDIKLGSLILHVTIPHRCFMTMEILHKALQSFLCQFFMAASIQQSSGNNLTVVLAESELLFAEPTNEDDLNYLNEKPLPILKLNVNVKDSAFNSEFVLHREINGFINGMYNSIDINNVPLNGSAREVLMLTANESVVNVTNSSDAKQDPLLRMAQYPVVSDMESNYFKISTLLLRITPKAVRIKFNDVFKPERLKATLKSNSSKLTDLKNNKCINQSQWNCMFPRKEDPTSKSFDTTLMICLFRNLGGIQVTNQYPTPTDFSISADLSRIKKYRQDIANSKDRTFTNAKFTSYWNETEAAVIRLSSGLVKRECCHLKTKTYDAVDRNHTHNLIHAGKRLVRIEELNEVADRVEKIDLKQASDKNRDFLEIQIAEWEEERKLFVQTNAFQFIRNNLDKRCFTIVGNPGMGKSMLLQQTALFLHESKDYSIISCQSPADIESQFRKDTKQVFILDDVCGQFTSVQSNVDLWNQYEIRILRVINSGKSVILASCRSQVFRESQCQHLSIFTGCLCDLNEGYCVIDYQQKLEIAHKYLSQNTISEVISDLDSFDMFPLSCKLYKDREIGKSTKFFLDPSQFYTEELDSFYRSGDEMICFSLFLCVLHSGRLKQTILMEDSEFSQTLETIYEQFGLKQTFSLQSILDGLDALLNIYLTKKDGQYNVLHDKLFDFLCNHFGHRYQQLFINHADSEIIRDRTMFKSLFTSPQDLTILIDAEYEKDYIERLVRDMLSGYIDDVLYNQQIRYKDFRYKLLSHLQEYDDDDQTVSRVLSEFVLDEKEKTSQLLPVNFACKYGYIELFEFFLSKTKDINAYEGNNIPLITACKIGNKYMTGLLLERGADVNQKDALGCSPLLWACVNGNLDIIKMLLDKKADLDNMDVRSKSSPLIWACVGELLQFPGIEEKVFSSPNANAFISFVVDNINEQYFSQEQVIDLLLTMLQNGYAKGHSLIRERLFPGSLSEEGDDMKKIMKDGNSKLCDVTRRRITNRQTQPFFEIMNFLLARGVEIDKSSKGGVTALSFACILGVCPGSQSIAYLLSSGADVNKSDQDGLQPLHIAIYNEREDLVNLLIKKGALMNCLFVGTSPLFAAIQRQNISILNILIKNGGDINKCSENGSTLLHYAINVKNADIIHSLIKAEISVNCKDKSGYTPLMLAVNYGLEQVVDILIKKGAVVNTSNAEKTTPLMHAVDLQHVSIADMLIRNGADINFRYEKGATPLQLAIHYNNTDLVKTLIKAGISVNCKDSLGNPHLMIAVDQGLTNICDILIKEGANVNTSNFKKITPLMIAVDRQNICIVNLLIKHGADINVRLKRESTLLHHSINLNNADLISTLITAGISVNSKDKSGNAPLMLAVNCGLEQIVVILIEKGAVVDTFNDEKITPLILAVDKQNIAIVNTLIKYEADINVRYGYGSSLVHRAINFHNADLVGILLKEGVSVNCEDKSANTPLMIAVNLGLTNIVVTLIKEGGIVNTLNSDKITPLRLAVELKNIAIADILIQSGADINYRYENGSTLLHRAVLDNNTDLINRLLKAELSVNSVDGKGTTPLMIAILRGLVKIVDILIKKGAEVNIKNYIGSSALPMASSKGDLDIFKLIFNASKKFAMYETTISVFLACNNDHKEVMGFLLQTGLDINMHVKKDGTTCLIEASERGQESMVMLLLEHGANVNASNDSGETSLTVASMKGHVALVQLLIAKNANRYKSNNNGESSLILACLNNHLEVVKVLIENGCNIESFEKKKKQTCLSVASYHAYDKIVTYLIGQGANVNTHSYIGNTPLILAASQGHLIIVQILIENKADLNIRNEKGSTSLSFASIKGFDKIAACLIEHEANVNTKSNIGTTPLILAASNGHLNIVKKLIEFKADVNIQNDKGSTCLSVASSKGFNNIVTYLLDQKASINTVNSDGNSPLMLASKNGHVSTVRILLENGAKVDMKNKESLSSLDLARESKHAEIANILCEFIQQNSE